MITNICICIVLIPTLTYSMTSEANSRGGERGSSCFNPAPTARRRRWSSCEPHQMLGTPSSSHHGTIQRARRLELKASALLSPASPLCPNKVVFLHRAPLAGNVGTRGGDRGTTGGGGTGTGGGGLGAGLGGLDGQPRRRPPRGVGALAATSMHHGRAAQSASTVTSTWCGRLGGDLDVASAATACTHHMSHTPPRSLVMSVK
jgi:hypothetical protein